MNFADANTNAVTAAAAVAEERGTVAACAVGDIMPSGVIGT